MMKRFICILLIIILTVPYALSESIDLSNLTFNELVALKERINLAIWNCDEWQEVEVPQGVYIVGENIPAGTWTVKCKYSNDSYLRFAWGDKLDESGQHITYVGSKKADIVSIYTTATRNYEDGKLLEYTFTCEDGDYIVIEYNNAVFSPYHGKQDLGFK